MTENELLSLLTLKRIPNLGDTSIKKLINSMGSAADVLQAKKSDLLQIDGIGTFKLKEFNNPAFFAEAKTELDFIQNNGIECTGFMQAHYPEALKQCLDGPVVLFHRGNINWNNPRIVSIVGTRKVTTQGVDFTKQLIEQLAPLNPIIVSGFAYGVDIAAHRAAIDHGLQTVAVMAHGLNQIYPKTHAKYKEQLETHGGFVTDFWSTDTFDRTNFLRRNRIIAGLSEATIVIESADRGGSLVTAEIANSYNREVFAVPGRYNDSQSKGCNVLIKTQKAQMLTDAADLVYMLNWMTEEKPKPIQRKLFVELTTDEQKIWNYLNAHEKEHIDTISLACEMPTYKLAGLLIAMELKGLLRPLPGKQFELL